MTLLTPSQDRSLEQADFCRVSFAGAESTVALYLAELGQPVSWVSRVGDDPFGRRILARLRECHVDTSLVVVDPDHPTGVYFKDPRPESTNVHYYRRGSAAAHMGPDLAQQLPLEQVRLVHVSGITAALSASCHGLVEALFLRARRAGALISFDVNFRPGLWSAAEAAAPLAQFARSADLVLVGRDEAAELWGTDSAESVARLVGYERSMVIKDGAVGATEFSGGASTFVPARAVDIVEPVGAGDAFAAGYLAQLLRGAVPSTRLAEGHRLAARALRSYDDFVPE